MTLVLLETPEIKPFTTQDCHLVSGFVHMLPEDLIGSLFWLMKTYLERDNQILPLSPHFFIY